MKQKKIIPALTISLALLATIGCAKKEKPADATAQTPAATTSAGTLATIKARDTLIVGVFGDIPPFGYVDSTGKNVGFDLAYARRFTQDLLGDSTKIKLVTLDPANRIEYLKSDKVDIVLADFTVTEERKQEIDFSIPYSKVSLGLIVPEGSSVKTVDDLKGKNLLVSKGTTGEIYFTEKYPDVKLVKFEENTALFQALKDKRGDALSQDNTLLFAWAKENPGYKVISGSIGSVDQIAAAVKKGNKDLLDWVNSELITIGKEQFGHKAYDAELKSHFSDDTKPEDVVVEGGVL